MQIAALGWPVRVAFLGYGAAEAYALAAASARAAVVFYHWELDIFTSLTRDFARITLPNSDVGRLDTALNTLPRDLAGSPLKSDNPPEFLQKWLAGDLATTAPAAHAMLQVSRAPRLVVAAARDVLSAAAFSPAAPATARRPPKTT